MFLQTESSMKQHVKPFAAKINPNLLIAKAKYLALFGRE